MSRWLWFLSGAASRLLWRASIFGVVAVVTALVSIYLKRFIPEDFSQNIGSDAVDGILNILASSMLAVTIFSLSTMVAAYGAATNNVTPRATKLLIEDKLSHNALSTFIGSFIFSIVGIIALKTGAYGDSGRLVLFLVTIGLIAIIIVTLLRWIEYLAKLGRVSETITRVEEVATEALIRRLRVPYLGGEKLESFDAIPQSGTAVYPNEVGYVQHIDMGALAHLAEKHNAQIYVASPPGKFIDPSFPLAVATGMDDKEALEDVRKSFVTGRERVFREDPRYGLAVLCEIASRALSPATNDSGTAIQIVGIGVRIFLHWAKRDSYVTKDQDGKEQVKHKDVYVPPLLIEDLFEDFFSPIARDGAGSLEVMLRLQKAYTALHATGDADLMRASRQYAAMGLKRSERALALNEDKEKLMRAADKILYEAV